MNKIISIEEISSILTDGMTIMAGGFMGVGTPQELVTALLEADVKDLTLIANDTAFIETGVGPLIVNKRVKKVIASHIGTNPETGKQMIEGELDVELVPQGTLAERVRAGGSGLGGVLTPTGVGTVVEEGKEKIIVDGREYLLEKPLRAEVAILKAFKADKAGNLIYHRSARNFNPLMALAADLVIVQVEQIVEVGEIDPDEVMTPGILVDKIFIQGGSR
ncbi:acetate CoA-transferase subunit alpha [Bacillus sp. ISL-40]|uniref:acetate CoA-transferase subunit alpha n=1 Tax=unclassified Bacillus (in: firmicutes) TaxID=185979 RepID=UPI001BEB11C9|nr:MULTISPECIES: acetate CoA-transferase subunit alpha [unclassified Bacillus (in: firmicutes)]MBT2699604.1 acetate CoA-transferase subunit alpha [Bacillus sp. ISL-40]MBT2724156.1 acetate CoA-transferase subunit alpha [Bacillus sp. ISL-46]MBT2741114.1 acetate CoA-transferase subunit alpha [Bacillus sp. ISL-77]